MFARKSLVFRTHLSNMIPLSAIADIQQPDLPLLTLTKTFLLLLIRDCMCQHMLQQEVLLADHSISLLHINNFG